MSVRVEVEEERTGDLVYSDTRHSEYRGGDPVDYSINISPLLTDGYYTVLVHLTTGGHNTSSLPLRLLMSKFLKTVMWTMTFPIQAEEEKKVLRLKMAELVNF